MFNFIKLLHLAKKLLYWQKTNNRMDHCLSGQIEWLSGPRRDKPKRGCFHFMCLHFKPWFRQSLHLATLQEPNLALLISSTQDAIKSHQMFCLHLEGGISQQPSKSCLASLGQELNTQHPDIGPNIQHNRIIIYWWILFQGIIYNYDTWICRSMCSQLSHHCLLY